MEPLDLYLVKNLRGIIYFSPKVDVSKEVQWLKKKFVYRDLGIIDKLLHDLFKGWTRLRVLKTTMRNLAWATLALASKYVCPLIVLNEKSLHDLEDAVIVTLKTQETLNDKEAKRNIRLVNYAITDLYVESIKLAKKSFVEKRKKLAIKDLRRYWRIKKSEKGKVVIAYLDPLLVLPPQVKKIYLALVPAFILSL